MDNLVFENTRNKQQTGRGENSIPSRCNLRAPCPSRGADCELVSRDHQAQGDQGMKTKGNKFCKGSFMHILPVLTPKSKVLARGLGDPEVYLGIISIENSVPPGFTDS